MQNVISKIFDAIKMLFVARLVVIIFGIFIFSSCNVTESDSTKKNSYSLCYIVEEITNTPVPYGQVNVVMNANEDLFWNTALFVDHLVADSKGRVEIPRPKYIELNDQHPVSSFFICADGPENALVDYYDDNCAIGGVTFDINSNDDIICSLPTKSWVRFIVDEKAMIQSPYNHLAILQPWVGGNGIGIYPESYNFMDGFIQEIYGNRYYTFPIRFINVGDGNIHSDSLASITVIAPPKDTLTITVSP